MFEPTIQKSTCSFSRLRRRERFYIFPCAILATVCLVSLLAAVFPYSSFFLLTIFFFFAFLAALVFPLVNPSFYVVFILLLFLFTFLLSSSPFFLPSFPFRPFIFFPLLALFICLPFPRTWLPVPISQDIPWWDVNICLLPHILTSSFMPTLSLFLSTFFHFLFPYLSIFPYSDASWLSTYHDRQWVVDECGRIHVL